MASQTCHIEVGHPLIQRPGFDLFMRDGAQMLDVNPFVGQRLVQLLANATHQHALIECRMKRQQWRMACESHEMLQRMLGFAGIALTLHTNAVEQNVLRAGWLLLPQDGFEAVCRNDTDPSQRPVDLQADRRNGDQPVSPQIEPGGFNVKGNPALNCGCGSAPVPTPGCQRAAKEIPPPSFHPFRSLAHVIELQSLLQSARHAQRFLQDAAIDITEAG